MSRFGSQSSKRQFKLAAVRKKVLELKNICVICKTRTKIHIRYRITVYRITDFFAIISVVFFCFVTSKDGSTVRLEFAYYVPRTLNRTVPAYRISVQFLKRIVPTYRTRTITKKAYRTSVPYLLAKIEAYRTVLTYRTALPSLLLTTRNFNCFENH